MLSKEEIKDTIYKCAKELNRQLPEESKLILEESTVIAGENSPLDSLGLATLIICIERHLTSLDVSINILDKFIESNEPPFVTIEEMSLWLIEQLK